MNPAHSTTTRALMVYVTAASLDEARAIGRMLVDKRLAACVNILPAVESLFWWQGRVQSAAECALVAKTTPQRMDELLREIKAAHSYEVPCVVALPIVAGNPDFLDWIGEETVAARP